jgi:arylsulfatase A-like enzyme
MTIDILPTLARLAGAALPPRPIDGKDIGPLLAGEAGARSPHEALYFYFNTGELQALRSGRWKLILPHTYRTLAGKPGGKDGKPVPYAEAKVSLELYDLVADPGETADRAAAEADVVRGVVQKGADRGTKTRRRRRPAPTRRRGGGGRVSRPARGRVRLPRQERWRGSRQGVTRP